MTTYRPISARLDNSPDKVKDSTAVASSGSAKIEDAADFLVSGDDPLTYIASSITKVDSIGLIDPEFTLSFSYDEQITSDDSDLIGEGNMSIVETIYPTQGWEPSDSSVIRMYRPLQGFDTNYPLFSVSSPTGSASSILNTTTTATLFGTSVTRTRTIEVAEAVPEDLANPLATFEIVLLPKYYSLEEQAINDKFGAPANGESVDSQVSDAFESAASDAYQTLVSRIYTAKTIRPQRLTISNIEDSGQESSTQISISTTSTTEAAYTP
jgi:hypothetical protein